MKKKKLKTLFTVYGVPLVLGVVLRYIVFNNFLNSPFRYYHKIPGLDMKTLFDQGIQSYNSGHYRSLYEFFIVCCKLLSSNYTLEVIIILQMGMGIIVSLLIAYITLHLTGNRLLSLLGGSIMALYAPSIICETQVLRESLYLFLTTLSLASLLYIRKKSNYYLLFGVGFLLILPVFARHASLLWSFLGGVWLICIIVHKKYKQIEHNDIKNYRLLVTKILKDNKVMKSVLFLFLGILIALVAKSSLTNSPLFPQFNTKYIFNVGSNPNTESINKPTSTKKINSTQQINNNIYFTKLFRTYNAFQCPNNVNYYFIRKMLIPVENLIGPTLLAPLALFGIIFILLLKSYHGIFKHTFIKKEIILFLYLIAFTIPLCIFLPLGRYKLVLIPATIPLFLSSLLYIKRIYVKCDIIKKLALVTTTSTLFILIFFTVKPKTNPIRGEDFLTYGLALSRYSSDFQTIEFCFQRAYQLKPTSKMIINLYANILMHNGKKELAIKLLKQHKM